MSFNIEKLECVNILEPRVDINKQRQYAILKGGQQVSFKPYTTNSMSTSSLQFSCPPPSPNIIVDRKIYLNIPFTITIPFVSTIGAQGVSPTYDTIALRSFPLSKLINTLQVTINNTSASINLGEIIDPLLRYNDKFDLKNFEYSMTPTMMDNSQNYNDVKKSSRDPLSLYGDNSYEIPRGSFPVDSFVITQTLAGGVGGQIILSCTITEPFFLSPLFFGCGNESGFIGVQTMDFNITLNNSACRMLSINQAALESQNIRIGTVVPAPLTPNYQSISFGYTTQPTILFTYITPQLLEDIPRDAIYPYFEVSRYPTTMQIAPLAPLASDNMESNNIQLQSIPRRMYIFARETYSTLLNSPNLTDTYFSINSISINWNNQSGLLSSATKYDLYNISKKNGCNLSWTEWSGKRMLTQDSWTNLQITGDGNSIAGPGSVLCIEFGTDIGLSDLECPGMLGTYQLQLKVNVTNPNPQNPTVGRDLYIVIVSEGAFNILDNRSISQIGVVTKQDVLEAQRSAPYLDYNTVESVQGSGSIFSSIKNFGTKVWDGLKKYVPIARKVAQAIPYTAPYANVGKSILGFGKKKSRRHRRGGNMMEGYDSEEDNEEEDCDISTSAGSTMSRSELKQRLKEF